MQYQDFVTPRALDDKTLAVLAAGPPQFKDEDRDRDQEDDDESGYVHKFISTHPRYGQWISHDMCTMVVDRTSDDNESDLGEGRCTPCITCLSMCIGMFSLHYFFGIFCGGR